MSQSNLTTAPILTKGDPEGWARGGEALEAVSVDTDTISVPSRWVVNPDVGLSLVKHPTPRAVQILIRARAVQKSIRAPKRPQSGLTGG